MSAECLFYHGDSRPGRLEINGDLFWVCSKDESLINQQVDKNQVRISVTIVKKKKKKQSRVNNSYTMTLSCERAPTMGQAAGSLSAPCGWYWILRGLHLFGFGEVDFSVGICRRGLRIVGSEGQKQNGVGWNWASYQHSWWLSKLKTWSKHDKTLLSCPRNW